MNQEQNLYRRRLLDVATALRETVYPDKFYMGAYVHPCGTPACALGNYAARRDLQREFEIRCKVVMPDVRFSTDPDAYCGYRAPRLHEYFGINEVEAEDLFSMHGCGLAKTATEAAAYIEFFVGRKWPTSATPDWNAIAAKQPVPDGSIRSPEYVGFVS